MIRPQVQTRSARAEVLDDGGMRCTLATEAPVSMLDWDRYEEVDEVLRADGAEFADKVPMLDSHHRSRCGDVLGHMLPKRDGSEIGARMVWDLEDPEAKRIAGKYERGHMTDVSVGYRVLEATYVEPGQSAVIGGRTHTAGSRTLKVATKWRIREGSPTPIGADENAKVRSAWEQARAEHLANERSEDAMSDPTTGTKPDTTAPDRGVAQQAERADESKVLDIAAIQSAAIEQDLKRQKEIADLGRSAKVDDALIQQAIHERWSADKFAKTALRAMRDQTEAPISTAPEVHVRGNYGKTKEQRLAALGMGLRHQLGIVERNGKVWTPPSQRGFGASAAIKAAERAAEEGYEYRNLSLRDYVRECYEISTGKTAPRGVRALLDATRASASNFDFANLLTTTYEAAVVMPFEEAPNTTAGWVRERDVENFRTNERPRGGQHENFEKLAKGGTAKHTSVSDDVESYKAYRYAKQMVIDEQDIINDRLGAFDDEPRRLGIAAARIVPDLVYYILANGEVAGLAAGAIFSSGNGNLGTSGALASATLRTGITAMLKQQEDGVNLNLMPKFLIVPVTILHTARELMESSTLLYGADDESVRGSKNVLFGQLEIRADARLDNGVTDPDSGASSSADTAAWYLAADPVMAPTIEVGYVRDTGRVPVVRSFVLDKGRWGFGTDVKFDVGAKALDHRGLYKAND